MEKQDKKQVELIEQVCDDFLIDVDQILAKDHLKRFSETTATELDKGLFLIDAEISGHGVDFKLLVNAEVLILFNGDLNFRWSDMA